MPSPRGWASDSPWGWASDSEAHHGAGSQTHIGHRPRRCGPQGSCSGPPLGGKTRGRRTSRLAPRPTRQCSWRSVKHAKLSSVAVGCRQGSGMNAHSVGVSAGCSAFAALHLALHTTQQHASHATTPKRIAPCCAPACRAAQVGTTSQGSRSLRNKPPPARRLLHHIHSSRCHTWAQTRARSPGRCRP